MSSSRRTTGDINILAMLDGQASGRRPRVLPAALRYGAAGVLACSLLATLVWLVQDDAPARDAGKDGAAQASLHAGAAGPAARPADATAPRDTQTAGAHGVELIVTQRDDLVPARDSMEAGVPGKGTVPAADPSASTAPRPAAPPLPLQMAPPATPPARAAAVSGARVNATTRGAVIIDMPQPAPTAMPASAATAPPAAPAHATADGHAATHTTAPARTPSLAHTGTTTAHQKRGASASRTAPPSAVDRDVAMISAILQHTVHSEAADTTPAPVCPDKPCAARVPSRQ